MSCLMFPFPFAEAKGPVKRRQHTTPNWPYQNYHIIISYTVIKESLKSQFYNIEVSYMNNTFIEIL